jgi:RNA polymerase sigma-70 factor (ECF subfamily)
MNSTFKPDWFDKVYQELYPRLYRYCLRFVDAARAADVVQEAFVKLLKESSDKPQAHMVPWLFQVCRHQCIDELRKGKKMKDSEDLNDDQIEQLSQGLEEKVYQDQISDQLNKALKILTFKEKEVIRLKFQEGFSYQQISQVTGHSLSYVGVLLHESLQKIKDEVLNINSKGVQNGKK